MPYSIRLSPLKIGIATVFAGYFLFTIHAMFNLSWIGEWESFNGSLRDIIFVEDVSASIGVAFRLAASAVALYAIILYFVKKGIQIQTIKKLLKAVLIGEAIYWLGLATTTILTLTSTLGFTIWRVNGHISTLPLPVSLLIYEIPLIIQSFALPAVLFKLSHELNPKKNQEKAIKWGLISGALYVLVIWLTSTTIWISTILRQGIQYLTNNPQNMLSFILTAFGMLALTIYTIYFAKKSIGIPNVEKLDVQRVGVIITAVGLFYLWNYLSWIFFGSDRIWSYWYLWFLGSLNLWLLSIPMVGLPLLFKHM